MNRPVDKWWTQVDMSTKRRDTGLAPSYKTPDKSSSVLTSRVRGSQRVVDMSTMSTTSSTTIAADFYRQPDTPADLFDNTTQEF